MVQQSYQIKIVICSPEDASSQMVIAEGVCQEKDDEYKELVRITSIDWGDLQPRAFDNGFKEPQKNIDEKAIKDADIFIGIMNVSIGKKEGFQHEVDLGLKKREYFKFYYKKLSKNEEEKLDKSTIEERERFIKDLYKRGAYLPEKQCQYKNDKDLEKLLRKHINKDILSLCKDYGWITFPEIGKKETMSLPRGKKKKKFEKEKLSSKKKVTKLPNAVIKSFKKLNFGKKLDNFEKIRLFLLASSFLYRDTISSGILENHEVQLLFRFKERIKDVYDDEKWLIFRTILSDRYHLKVGWYWFKAIKKLEEILFFAAYFLHQDSSREVKIGALDILDKFWDKRFFKFLEGLENDEHDSVRNKVLDILKDRPADAALEIVRRYLQDDSDDVRKKAKEVKFIILSVLKPHQAIEELFRNETIDYYKIDQKIFPKAFEAELRKLLEHKNKNISLDALKELIRRESLTKEDLIELTKEESWDIRYLALWGLLKKGEELKPAHIEEILKNENRERMESFFSYGRFYNKENLLRIVYEKLEPNELERLLEWGYYGALAYEVMGLRHFQRYKNQVKDDLKDGFAKREGVLVEKTASRLNIPPKEFKNIIQKYSSFIEAEFIAAGLKILLRHGNKTDLKIAYRLVNHQDWSVRGLSFKIIAKYGSQKDALLLFESALKINDYSSCDLIREALRLDVKREYKIFNKCIESKNEKFLPIGLAFCLKNNIKVDLKEIKPLLFFKNDNIRDFVVLYIVLNFTRKELEKLLEEYYNSPSYFYNVVSRLDLFLYAPVKLRNYYKKDLKKKLLSKLD